MSAGVVDFAVARHRRAQERDLATFRAARSREAAEAYEALLDGIHELAEIKPQALRGVRVHVDVLLRRWRTRAPRPGGAR